MEYLRQVGFHLTSCQEGNKIRGSRRRSLCLGEGSDDLAAGTDIRASHSYPPWEAT